MSYTPQGFSDSHDTDDCDTCAMLGREAAARKVAGEVPSVESFLLSREATDRESDTYSHDENDGYYQSPDSYWSTVKHSWVRR